MAKKERKLVDKYAQQQMEDIKTGIGGTVEDLKGQAPAAKQQATESFGAAKEGATALGTGTSNPYVSALAGGGANPYATNLAVTGGISEDEAQKMETTATRGVRSVYDVLGAEAKRKSAITGGYGGGGELAQMARQGGQKQAEALTDAGAQIARLRQGGRVSGAGMVQEGMTAGAQMSSSQQIVGNQLLTQQYGLSAEQAQFVQEQILKAQTAGAQLTQGDIELLAQMSKQPGALTGALQTAGQLMSGAGSVMTGIKAIR